MSQQPTPSRLPVTASRTAGLGKRQLSHTNIVHSTALKRQKQNSTDNLASGRTMRPPTSTLSRLNRHNSTLSLTTPVTRAAATPATRNTMRAAVKENASAEADRKCKTGKRPAWDLKGRIHDMEERFKLGSEKWESTQSEMDDLRSKLSRLEQENTSLESSKRVTVEQANAVEQQLAQLRNQLSQEVNEKNQRQMELQSVRLSNETMQLTIKSLEGELAAKSAELTLAKASLSHLTAAESSLKCQLAASQQLAEQLRSQLADTEQQVERLEQESRQHETLRRHLHNTVQELKGNIRVFCRVRPLLPTDLAAAAAGTSGSGSTSGVSSCSAAGEGDDSGQTETSLSVVDARTLEVRQPTSVDAKCGVKKPSEPLSFSFDQVFSAASSQQQVFSEISHLVQSVVDGYNVCVFAYGQTGSGKTFTMEGGCHDEQAGMIPRAVRQIFQCKQQLADKGWQYTLESSFLEIYNETLRDLLNVSKSPKPCEIRMADTKSKEVYVSNLKTVMIESEADIERLMSEARQHRAVAATKCNERSSRSHCVFTLKLCGNNALTGETCQGSLNLVDLAGSERVKESGSQGDRLTEAKSINKSLSNLANVILALAQKQEHVPYRNSKLTHLLQHSLGGNSKTLMFVNVSPRADCLSETVNSLRFAVKVNKCHIGTAAKRF